jgi:hypothetical protein
MADLVWSDPDAEKEDFAISPRSVFTPAYHQRYSLIRFTISPLSRGAWCLMFQSVTNHVEVLDTRLDQVSYTSSWKRTTCHIFYARISSAWKDIRHCLTNTFRLYGQRPTIVIVVAIPRAYSRWVPARECISMSSRLPRRTIAMVQISRLPRMLVGRYVTVSF